MKSKIFSTIVILTLGFSAHANNVNDLVVECDTDGTAAQLNFVIDKNYKNPQIQVFMPTEEFLDVWPQLVDEGMANLLSGRPALFVGSLKNADSNGGGTAKSGMLYFDGDTRGTNLREAIFSAYGNVYQMSCKLILN